MTKQKRILVFLATVLLLQACMQVKLETSAPPTAQQIVSPTQTKIIPTQTARIFPTATLILPTETAAPDVTIGAVKGNVFIRRGPDMAYNPISVLYKDTTAKVVAHDVLFKWAQIMIPNSKEKGWVSLQTQYAKIEGDINALPEQKAADWPQPAYLRNCTHHQLFIQPGAFYLDTSYTVENEIWLYPGHYVVYDIDMPDTPSIAEINMSEGATVEINEDAAGEYRKCPK